MLWNLCSMISDIWQEVRRVIDERHISKKNIAQVNSKEAAQLTTKINLSCMERINWVMSNFVIRILSSL
ncbi:hypothetical protein FGO68_gene756 [Halteria grandinella]|uniref:Uncharacterized protein n=1 Tax=Halteria grandinella TaxID=5974 RepID=A0A8J8T7Z9_HALGN|nr:hypothetical protein FGO68_gene756 [Halteria grandinella]